MIDIEGKNLFFREVSVLMPLTTLKYFPDLLLTTFGIYHIITTVVFIIRSSGDGGYAVVCLVCSRSPLVGEDPPAEPVAVP
jgi:hypothetical protein